MDIEQHRLIEGRVTHNVPQDLYVVEEHRVDCIRHTHNEHAYNEHPLHALCITQVTRETDSGRLYKTSCGKKRSEHACSCGVGFYFADEAEQLQGPFPTLEEAAAARAAYIP